MNTNNNNSSNINNNNTMEKRDASAHETFADEDVNATDSLSGIEASNDPVRVEAAKNSSNNNSSNSGPPLKGVLRSRGGRNDDASSSSGSDNEDLTDSKPRSTAGSEELPPKIAAREAKYVLASKFLVALVLMVSAGLLGYFSYALTRADEEAEFEQKFADYANEIVRSSADNARNSFTVLGTFARTITSLALYANKTWPFITLPDFEVRAQDYRSISSAEEVAFAPIVHDMDREAYEAYTVENQDWIQRGLDYEYQLALEHRAELYNHKDVSALQERTTTTTIAPGTNMEGFAVVNKAKPIEAFIWRNAPLTHRAIPEQDKGPLVPVWQSFPAPKNSFVVNHNLKATTEFNNNIATAISNRTTVLSDIVDNFKLFGTAQTINLDPKSVVIQPIFQHFHDDKADIVAFLIVITNWDVYFQHVLYEGAEPVIVVLQNSCGKVFSFEIVGPKAIFLGEGDFHNPSFDYLQVTTEFSHPEVFAACDFYLHVYPTQEMQDTHLTSLPIYVTLAVTTVFVFTTMVFILYDFLVTKRQEKVMASANATNRIVSNLFPKAVRDRLIQDMVATDADNQSVVSGNSVFSGRVHPPHHGPKRPGATTFMNLSMHGSNHTGKSAKSKGGGGDGTTGTSEDIFGSKPIAELFPETTIMFADMVGFTAWSSIREPTHVFLLLETIYHAFDTIAKRRRVFKVETIGDCYVAVAGLPVPRKDHAVVMARFASECLSKMNDQVKHLEAQLGPDTGDLTLRIGLHSGAVTAGVLRGEKGRFQLFGDTMNTASRMESTGMRGRIQVSRETAALLIEADKQSWVTEREEKVHAKGKGELQTYWLQIKAGSSNGDATSVSGLDASSVVNNDLKESVFKPTQQLTGFSRFDNPQAMADKMAMIAKSKRLVDWNTDILAKLLKQIIIRRTARKMKKLQIGFHGATVHREVVDTSFDRIPVPGLPMDAVVDIISLPHFDPKSFAKHVNPDSIDIPDVVMAQLSAFVGNIANLYQLNAFHNFEHASHVTMSVTKLLSRIVQPKFDDAGRETDKILHDHTFGITSDPLTQFACVISALIHDADHQGVTNAVLIQEEDPLAIKYKQKSVAEQNSVDLAWRLLMSPQYMELRKTIYTSEEEFHRFRQIIVNIVLATDIMDKELGAQRKARWEKAFNSTDSNVSKTNLDFCVDDDDGQEEKEQRDVNRKATIVLEHLIQASDVAHTMQHWHVYRKWNERLFEEMYTAFKAGRVNIDPSLGWYKGEIGFFDFYIIPLAKKLETCGVFGVASSEYLGYAEANRREWEAKGEGIVKEYLAKYGNKEPAGS